MKTLESMRLVQFFLFEKQQIELAEVTGIFGPNGSGKSSLLDAVQIAMMGANRRHVALNAQAEGKAASRTLRAYCLGQYGDSPEQRVRDHATTYITLVWRDTVTNEPLSMGVCIRVSADREGHEVLGRYIARGVEISMGDHIEIVDGRERPREWSTFRHQLSERAKMVSGEDPFFQDSERFIRGALLALRGSGGLPVADSFIRTFKFALHMKFDKAVDLIVREDVLEARPTNVGRFREVSESFHRLNLLVASLVMKIEKGERVLNEYVKAVLESRHTATWQLLSKKAFSQIAREKLDEASAAAEQAAEQLKSLEADKAALDQKLAAARQSELQARAQREAHTAHKDYGALQTEIQQASEQVEAQRKMLANTLLHVQRTLEAVTEFESLKAHQENLDAVCETLDPLRAAILAGSAEQAAVFAALERAVQVADAAFNDLLKGASTLDQALARARDREKVALEDLGRVKAGKAPLSEDATRLLLDLRDRGVSATPVCELVRIRDAAWQPVIEAYLKSNVEALLVDSEQASTEAFRIYRENRAVYGVKIVSAARENTGKTYRPGTVAALIEGDHPAAVAYLQRQFGDMVCASTNAEALGNHGGHRSLTIDGMLVSGSHFERIRPVSPSNLKIGADSGARREAIEQDLAAARNEIRRLESERQKVEALRKKLQSVATEDTVVKHATTAWEAMAQSILTAATKRGQMQQAADGDYLRLSEEERRWAEQVAGYTRDAVELTKAVTRAEEAQKTVNQALGQAQQVLQDAIAAVEADRANPEVDPEFEVKQWDLLIEKYDSDCEAMRQHAEAQRVASQRRMEAAINSGNRELGTFINEYNERIPPEVAESWVKTHEWLGGLLKTLRDTELVSNQARLAEALRISEETFRNDVAITLNNNFEWLEETMDRLNKVLRECPPFSNGERYRFRRKVRPHLEPLMRFIKNVAAFGPSGDLLGGPSEMPPEFHALLEDKAVAGNAGAKNPLDDYREFFEFDIEILREDVETKASKVVGLLSKRLGPGSGGEHRAPLYVIAGAALASAYRLDSNHRDGIRLMLLDEAFNKMDHTNTTATMRYLEDLGLQLFMATPGENLGNLNGFLHCYYDILRDVDSNVILLGRQDVSKGTRSMSRSDLPEFNPDLILQEIANMQAGSPQAVVEMAG